MLTYTEIPGIYVNTTNGQVTVIDQVVCHIADTDNGRSVLTVRNPTNFPAKVKLLPEDEEQAAHPLGQCASMDWRRIELAPGESIQVLL